MIYVRGSMNILLLEDDVAIREIMITILESEGYSVISGQNGVEGLKHLTAMEQPPSIVLVDLSMPLMDGTEFLNHLNASPRWNAIPRIILTAAGNTKVPHHLADEVLKKPVHLEDLISTVEQYIEKRLEPSRSLTSELACMTSSHASI